MIHLKLKQEITNTIKETKLGLIPKNQAFNKLNNLYKEKNCINMQGHKRDFKNDIYNAKKLIKLF